MSSSGGSDRVSNWDQYGRGMPQSLHQLDPPLQRPDLAATYDGRLWLDPRAFSSGSKGKVGTSGGFSLTPREPPVMFTDRHRRMVQLAANAAAGGVDAGAGPFMKSWQRPAIHAPSWYRCYDQCRSEGGTEHTC